MKKLLAILGILGIFAASSSFAMPKEEDMDEFCRLNPKNYFCKN